MMGDVWVYIQFLFAALALIAFAIKDIRERIIPDKWIALAIAGSLVIRLFYSPGELLSYIGAAALLGFLFLVVAMISNGGLGGGDVKLFAWLGLTIGLNGALWITLISSVLGITFAYLLKKESIPFAPFVFIGFAVCQSITFFGGGV